MGIDRNRLRAKLKSLEKPAKREKVDYSKYLWKPGYGKYNVRILPCKYQEDGFPFLEKYFHYALDAGFPVISIGEDDPIVQIANKLKKSDSESERKLGYQLAPKLRVFVPVIVRGEEDKGVRFFQFGKSLYEFLLQTAEDEDGVGDYSDIREGNDFTVNVVEAKMDGGKTYPDAKFSVKVKKTPLSTNAAEIEKWLEEQPDLSEIYQELSPEKLEELLEKALDKVHEAAPDAPAPKTAPVNKKKTTTDAVPSSDYTDLFDEDE